MVQSGQVPQQMAMHGHVPPMMAPGQMGMQMPGAAMQGGNPYAAQWVPVTPTGGSAKAREPIDRSPSGWTPLGKKMGLRCFNLKNHRPRCAAAPRVAAHAVHGPLAHTCNCSQPPSARARTRGSSSHNEAPL